MNKPLEELNESLAKLENLLSEIEKAKRFLESAGYSVLQWQTGEPEKETIVLYVTETGSIFTGSYNNVMKVFYNNSPYPYPLKHVKRWAYLPEGGNK